MFATPSLPGMCVYALNSKTEPFSYSDHRFGVPKRADLHFVVLRKGSLRIN